LVLFKDIEANGGFQKLNEGVIKRKSRKVPTKNRTFDSGKETLGTINTQTRTTE
jgi:hypothetical protein